jgi:phage-related baseplate assembly protein
MTTENIETLTTPVSKEDAQKSIYEGLATVGVNTTSWKPGAVVRTLIAIVAILFAATTNLIADIAKAGFLELTSGSWLTIVARYVYGVMRLEATFGTGTLTLVNSGGGVYEDIEPGDFSVKNPDTDKEYTNAETFTLGAGATLTINIVAREAGAESTSAIGTIVTLITTLPGVTCSNPTAVVGADEEEDEPLKQRCRDKLGARSANGPSDAYASIAREAVRADGSAIGVTRIRPVRDGKGNIYIYLATPTGGVTGTADDIATDLGVINDAIQRRVAPLAVTAHTLSATAHPFNVSYTLWMLDTSGLTNAQLAIKIEQALAKYFGAAPIGGYKLDGAPGRIYQDDIKGVIKSVRPLEIFRVELSSPAADTDLTTIEAPTIGTVAGTITQVQQRVY